MQVKGYPKQQGIILSHKLEVCELAINIVSFSHLLKRVDFDAILEHLALMNI